MQEIGISSKHLEYAEIAKQCLDEMNINYLSKPTSDKYVLIVPLVVETVGSITLNMIINDSGFISAIYCAAHNVGEDKIPAVLRRLNKINAKYQLFKFYLDDDHDVMFQYDSHLFQVNKEIYNFEILKILSIAKLSSNEIPEILREVWDDEITDKTDFCTKDHNRPDMDEENEKLPEKKKTKRYVPVVVVTLLWILIIFIVGIYQYKDKFYKNGVDCSLPKTVSANKEVSENDHDKESEETSISESCRDDSVNSFVSSNEKDREAGLDNKNARYYGDINIVAPPGYQKGETASVVFYYNDGKQLLSEDVDSFPREYRLSDMTNREVTVRVRYESKGMSQTVSKKIRLNENVIGGDDDDKAAFEKNDCLEINKLFDRYFSALSTGDLDELNSLQKGLRDEDRIRFKVRAKYIGEYKNIACYTLPGLNEDTLVAMVSYELLLKDTDTPAPGLSGFYLKKDNKGEWYIQELNSLDKDERDYYNSVASKGFVNKLCSKIDKKLKDNLKSDGDLKYKLDEMDYCTFLTIEEYQSGTDDFEEILGYDSYV